MSVAELRMQATARGKGHSPTTSSGCAHASVMVSDRSCSSEVRRCRRRSSSPNKSEKLKPKCSKLRGGDVGKDNRPSSRREEMSTACCVAQVISCR